MRPVQDAFPLLQTPKKIFITTHHKPDGDAIGSMLGLYHYLIKKGHSVTAASPGELPDFLMWIPGVSTMLNYESEPKDVLQALRECDIIFGLDFNGFGRTKHLEKALTEALQPKILIDHHLQPEPVWDYGMSIPEKSSTAEMVYDFINMNNDNSFIDKDIAACIYTGVMTDTGSFRFPVTTASVHQLVADLKHKGLDHSYIHDEVYDSWTLGRMRFLGYVLVDKMEIFPKYNAGLISLTRKEMNLFNVRNGDTEGLVNEPISIKGIVFSNRP